MSSAVSYPTSITDERGLAPAAVPGRRAFFGCALLVTLSVFPLIWMGGVVTSHGAGLSVPDWPNSNGYNMFLFPPTQWVGGIFYEHSHRLLGTVSGLLSIALVSLAFGPAHVSGRRHFLGIAVVVLVALVLVGLVVRQALLAGLLGGSPAAASALVNRTGLSHVLVLIGSLAIVGLIMWCSRGREPRSWVRYLAVGQLLAVCVQGTLGGLRVTESSLGLAMVHACLAQCIFACSAVVALVSSRWWLKMTVENVPAANGELNRDALDFVADGRSGSFASPSVSSVGLSESLSAAPVARRLTKLGGVLAGLIFCQLVAGATMRHNNAGLAIPDLPLAFGHLVPPTNQTDLDRANDIRRWTFQLPGEMSYLQIWQHFAHRVGAVLVAMVAAVAGGYAVARLRRSRLILTLACLLLFLVAGQFTLGLLTVWLKKPADIASLHVAVGALTFATTWLLTSSAARLAYASQSASVGNGRDGDGDGAMSRGRMYHRRDCAILSASSPERA